MTQERSVLLAPVVALLASSGSWAQVSDMPANCARYDAFSVDQILPSLDPLALHCLAMGVSPQSSAPPEQALARILVDISRNRVEHPDREIASWLANDPDPSVESIASAFRALGGWYVARQQEQKAALLNQSIRLRVDRKLAMEALDAVGRIQPRPAVKVADAGATTATVRTDKKGRQFVDASIDSEPVRVFFDTGANINVVSESLARRLNFRFLGGESVSGWTERGIRNWMLAVAPPIEVGGMRLEDVLVHVESERDTVSGDDIGFGAPVLNSIGQLAWLDGGKRIALGNSAPTPECVGASAPFHHLGGFMVVMGEVASGPAPIIFDSGFVHSFVNERSARFYSPETKFTSDRDYWMEMPEHRGNRISTRGVRKLSMALGDAKLSMRDVRAYAPIETGAPGYVAWLGTDILKQVETLVIDFETMTFAVAPKGQALRTCPNRSTVR